MVAWLTIALLLSHLPAVADSAVAAGQRCEEALAASCGSQRGNPFECTTCAGEHATALQHAGCDNDDIAFWCSGECPSGYVIRNQCVPTGVSPLQFYVDLPDPSYRYEGPIQQFPLPGATAYVLNMTSQTWLSDDIFKTYSPVKSTWWHQLTVVVPTKLDPKLTTGWLWITGGGNSNHSKQVDPEDQEVAVAAALAVATKTIGAVLNQIPNQPTAFAVDIPHDPHMYPRELREEDGIIAYTWNHFVYKQPHMPEFLLRMPMTKAVVRAMDTVIDYANTAHGSSLERFVVGGASKRGWTTWTTGVVDKRCAALVPVVMDLLNLAENTAHSFESLGGWTFAYADYTNAAMVGPITQSPEFQSLASIVDPYSYLSTKQGYPSPWPATHFERVPKLVVDGGNDEFFLPDDNHIWWGDMPGEKHLLHIPNADHPLSFLPANESTGVEVFSASLLAFYSAVVQERPRPTFDWSISADGLAITVGNFSVAPKTVSVWHATTSDGFRDFRLYNCRGALPGHNCTSAEHGAPGGPAPHVVKYTESPAASIGHNSWEGRVPPPPTGSYFSYSFAERS